MKPYILPNRLELKNKAKTYVLLVLVIGVWGTVAYKIVAALNPDLPELPQQELSLNTDFKMSIQRDTFSIQRVNRDPFLGTLEKPKKTVKKKRKATTPQVQWMPIAYNGMISKGGSNKIFLISINGQQHLLKQGQIREGVKVVSLLLPN